MSGREFSPFSRDWVLSQVNKLEKQSFPKSEILDIDAELKKRNLEVIVILGDSQNLPTTDVVGYLVICFAKAGGVVSLHKICVAPEYRATGTGTKMLKDLVDSLRIRGKSRLQLWVAASNTVALRFYHKAGFTKGSEVAEYYSPKRSGISMTLHIS